MKKIVFVILAFCILIGNPALANIFSMLTGSDSGNAPGENMAVANNTIPIVDTTDKHLQKRLQEAQALIYEGRMLVKKGEQRNKKELITKGKIKKEIGEKQLVVIKRQMEEKKEQDHRDEW